MRENPTEKPRKLPEHPPVCCKAALLAYRVLRFTGLQPPPHDGRQRRQNVDPTPASVWDWRGQVCERKRKVLVDFSCNSRVIKEAPLTVPVPSSDTFWRYNDYTEISYISTTGQPVSFANFSLTIATTNEGFAVCPYRVSNIELSRQAIVLIKRKVRSLVRTSVIFAVRNSCLQRTTFVFFCRFLKQTMCYSPCNFRSPATQKVLVTARTC